MRMRTSSRISSRTPCPSRNGRRSSMRQRSARELPRLFLLLALALALTSCGPRPTAGPATVELEQTRATPPVGLPNVDGSFKFAVLGDFGNGERVQYELADQMVAFHKRFKYEYVILVGDNIYGSERPQDFVRKF